MQVLLVKLLIVPLLQLSCLLQEGSSSSETKHSDKCTEAAILECLDELIDDDSPFSTQDVSKYDLHKILVPILTKEEVDEICSTYQTVKNCLQENHCTETVLENQLLETIGLSSYQFFCKERNKFIQYKSCYDDGHIRNETYQCYKSLTYEMYIIKESSRYYSEKLANICITLETYLSCVDNTTSIFCEDSLGIWLKQLIEKIFSELLKSTGCRKHELHILSSDIENSSFSKLSIIAIILVIAIVVIGIFVCCILKMELPNSNDEESRTNTSFSNVDERNDVIEVRPTDSTMTVDENAANISSNSNNKERRSLQLSVRNFVGSGNYMFIANVSENSANNEPDPLSDSNNQN